MTFLKELVSKSHINDGELEFFLRNHWLKYVPVLFNSQNLIIDALKEHQNRDDIYKILFKPLEAYICNDLNSELSKLDSLNDEDESIYFCKQKIEPRQFCFYCKYKPHFV
jgi:hypothetical protein